MPIFKTNYGKHGAITVVSFGSGDILISPCKDDENSHMNMVWLTRDVEKPESEWHIDPGHVNTDDLNGNNAIALKFTVTKSIDTLIDQLLLVKESMLNKNH